MLTTPEKLLFVVIVAASLAASYVTFGRLVRVIGRGQGHLALDNAPRRIRLGLSALLNQGGILRHRRVVSVLHEGVALGFVFYLLVNAVDVLEGYIDLAAIQPAPVFGALAGVYRLFGDLFTVAVLVGVAYFLARRFVRKDPALRINANVKLLPGVREGIARDSLIVGAFILLHVGLRLLGQSFAVAKAGGDAWQPFATALGGLWRGLSPEALEIGHHAGWWGALGLILAFLPYFPYTKHAHLFMGPFNIATRPERAALGALEPINFDDTSIEKFGVKKLTELNRKHIVDAFACIMCNRCAEACPAYTTGKELSPAALEINKRYYVRSHMNVLGVKGGAPWPDEQPLLDYAISESAVWACTSCGACVEVCPVGNEPMFDILNIRRDQVLMDSAFPGQLKGAFTGMERNANPWQMSEDRMAWTAGLPFAVPTVEENPGFDVLYWVGCAGAFDPSAQRIARAIATVLHSAGVNFAVLGNAETCTGDVARRAGNEYLFFEMAKMVIETLNGAGADKKTIVAGCPHCLHTIGKEYRDFGARFDVVHHTQFINRLVGEGKLALDAQKMMQSVTFHDPCYLGRHNREYDAPRRVLAGAGATLAEMPRSRADSFCCGAGGAQVWKEEEHGTAAVNIVRFDEAKATGAATLAVGCPFCARMLNDANAAAGTPMRVKDVAELVAEALR